MLANLDFKKVSANGATPEMAALLERVKQKFGGGVPPIKGLMANSPVTVESYLDLHDNMGKTSFSKIEQQAMYLYISSYNECGYCTKAHTHVLTKMLNQPEDEVAAVAAGQPTGHEKTDVLIATVKAILEGRGEISEEQRARFVAAGYTDNQLIDLLTAISMKLITNYFGRMAQLD